mmetsp:Transcript_25981/g.12287  ORF Transcript_25981/g.12287 Transcript_25981/m.12287 type:complete len:96 (+) Transcript_25981:406-693(+)
MVGTWYFLSPELCENLPYSYPTDVWSLGCVLYELCTLRHVFEAATPMGLGFKILKESFTPVQGYSPELSQLVEAMLKKDPAMRPTIKQILASDWI